MRWVVLLRYLAVFLLKGRWFATATRRDDMCRFPTKWEGTWFQSGVRTPITIELNRFSSKGRCLASEGDRFLIVQDNGSCHKCIVIHEKHINVLQYKETFCHARNTLHNLCTLITGDAQLFSMFRLNAQAVHCPFKPPMTFTYNRGYGTCKSPISTIDGCIEESKIVMRFQACPDVSATESSIEEMECLAVWKEGNSRFLVGKLLHGHIKSDEDLFRCFVYEKATLLPNGEMGFTRIEEFTPFLGSFGVRPPKLEIADFRVAQSGDATCNGLFNTIEGSRTMLIRKAPVPNKCKFPGWLTYFQHWHTLDYRKSYTFHHRNTTLKITNNSAIDISLSDGSQNGETPDVIETSMGLKSSLSEDGEIRLICSDIKSVNQIQANIIAHFTMGCQSGYVCLWFYKRDAHVIEVQSGSTSETSNDACGWKHFNSQLPYITLVTTNPEPRDCPYSGKFSVAGISKLERQKRSIAINEYVEEEEEREEEEEEEAISTVNRDHIRLRRNFEPEEPCEDEVSTMVVGCETSDTLEFRSQCSTSDIVAAYSCHGRWTENETNFLITTPQSRTSIGAKRYCFIYRESGDIIHFSSSSQSCVRSINTGVEGVLAFNATSIGKCLETNKSAVAISNVILMLILISISTWLSEVILPASR